MRRKGHLLAFIGIASTVGCGGSSQTEESSVTDTEALRPESALRMHRHPSDAGLTDTSTTVDAATPPGPVRATGIVACYTEGNPTASCAVPAQECCFNNYSSQHDGFCTTAACTYGTIRCDGPEDCAGGNVCCSTRLFDADNMTTGYVLACRAGSTCGSDDEVCHASSTCHQAGTQCRSAAVVDYDLPRVISLCRP